MIPIYIIEEHKDAFYVWNLAVERGQIPKTNNLLLHVDHHDDLDGGSYDHDFTSEMKTLEEKEYFTTEVLGIADFIMPTFYYGLFNEMINFKSIFPKIPKTERIVVKLLDNNTLTTCKYIPFVHEQHYKSNNTDYRFIDMTEGSLCDMKIRSCVLDIDLDYFCWDDSLTTGKKVCIEVSKSEYEAYKNDTYHPFKITAKKILKIYEEDGKYYLTMNIGKMSYKETKRSNIDKRIANFMDWLGKNEVEPLMINICRSRYSGYCPVNQWEYVESKLLTALEKRYDLDKQVGNLCV